MEGEGNLNGKEEQADIGVVWPPAQGRWSPQKLEEQEGARPAHTLISAQRDPRRTTRE